MARTYESALSHLAALQSNRAVTSLFTPPAPTPSSTPGSKPDLNALAIPEMQAWLRRGGISASELAGSGLRCIHVAGTKGKGSVCAYLTALLTHSSAAGKVGTYTSPHLVSVRERIAINGVPMSRDLFARYFFAVWDACTDAARAEQKGEGSEDALRGPATKPFYFRFLTLVALRAFLGEGVRTAVVECGIGGEYDSTNVLPAELVTASVVAQLGIDHVGMLGATLPEIAWHKAGVCKPGRACFTRRLEGDETMRVLRRRAQEKSATLVEVEDMDVVRWGGVQPTEKTAGALEGEFQKYNQALAVLAAREHLRVLAGGKQPGEESERLDSVPASFTSALQYARLRGRCETHEDEKAPVTWLIDGAHTAESLAEVARWYTSKVDSREDETRILLFNQQDRDAARLVGGLLRDIEVNPSASPSNQEEKKQNQIFAHAVFTRNDIHPRVTKAETEADVEPERDLTAQHAAAEALRNISPATTTSVVDNVADAVSQIRAIAKQQHHDTAQRTTVLVTGSLHLVGALLRTLEPDAED
ncbi:FolC bifunctional protein [Xylaria telfairii]|nr:FolC bifunctional protein [Xylaria telfairii]